jgi:hypothetical protein
MKPLQRSLAAELFARSVVVSGDMPGMTLLAPCDVCGSAGPIYSPSLVGKRGPYRKGSFGTAVVRPAVFAPPSRIRATGAPS